MKHILHLLMFAGILMFTACDKECEGVICENDGVCIDGTCECVDYYTGDRCQIYDPEGTQGTTTTTTSDGDGGCSGHGDGNDNPYKD